MFMHIYVPTILQEFSTVILMAKKKKKKERKSMPLSHCFLVAQSCPTLCDPMDCSVPGFLALHHFLELAQIHVHQVSDAI